MLKRGKEVLPKHHKSILPPNKTVYYFFVFIVIRRYDVGVTEFDNDGV
jgi:hypothetical protein